jgi:hypothetical protein
MELTRNYQHNGASFLSMVETKKHSFGFSLNSGVHTPSMMFSGIVVYTFAMTRSAIALSQDLTMHLTLFEK